MEIYLFEGARLDDLLDELNELVEDRAEIRRIRVTVDGGLKLKVDGGAWTPPLGELDPMCQAAQQQGVAGSYGYPPGNGITRSAYDQWGR